MLKIARRTLFSGAAALALCAGLSEPASAFWHSLNSTPVTLPNTPLADFPLQGSSNAYVSLGNITIPAGNWCFGVAVKAPTAAGADYFVLSVGTPSASILTSNSNFQVGWAGAVGAPYGSYGWSAVGTDDSGNQLATQRSATLFNSSVQYGVTGPQQYAGVSDGLTRMIFVQMQNGVISIWQVDPNCTARQWMQQVSAFNGIANQPATLGGCNTASPPTSLSTISYQRPFLTAQNLTQYQMEAIASGVDPRAVATFNASTDYLWALPSSPSNGQTFTDLIQGKTATANGTFGTPTALLPTTIDPNQVRFDVDPYQVFQAQGSTTNVFLRGTVYGADGQIQITTTTTGGSTILPYTFVANTINGQWAGVLNTPTVLTDFVPRARKLIAGVATPNTYNMSSSHMSTGRVVQLIGQSLNEQMRITGNYGISSGVLSGNGRIQATPLGIVQSQHFAPGVGKWTAPGYGEGRLIQDLGNALNTQVMIMNDAISGSTIQQWIGNTAGYNSGSPIGMMDNFIANCNRYQPTDIYWHQGEQNLGLAQGAYYALLTQLFNIIKSRLTYSNWKFIVVPVNNNFTATVGYDEQMQAIRSDQINWANDQVAAGNTQVLLGCTVNDVLLANMQGGGIHAQALPGGYGLWSERYSRTSQFLAGAAANSALGPSIASAVWTRGTPTVTVSFNQNGGTGLTTPNAGNITGFAFSASLVAGAKVPFKLGTLLSQASAVISGDTTKAIINFSSIPTSAPYMWYHFGCPGLGLTDAALGINNCLYDNRGPTNISGLPGFPVQPMTAPLLCATA